MKPETISSDTVLELHAIGPTETVSGETAPPLPQSTRHAAVAAFDGLPAQRRQPAAASSSVRRPSVEDGLARHLATRNQAAGTQSAEPAQPADTMDAALALTESAPQPVLHQQLDELGSLAFSGTIRLQNGHIVSDRAMLRVELQRLAKTEEEIGVPPQQRLARRLDPDHPADLTFTIGDDELDLKLEQFRDSTSRSRVELYASRHDHHLVEAKVGGSYALPTLYGVLENRNGGGLGPNARIRQTDNENDRGVPVLEHLASLRPRFVSRSNPAFAAYATELLNHPQNDPYRAKLSAAIMLHHERYKELPVKGPLLSVLVDLAVNLPYELVGAPAWKNRVFNGVPPASLPTSKKIYGAFIEAMPTLFIEVADTFASLLSASEIGRREFEPFKAFLTSVASGHISLGTAFIAAGLRYAAPESEAARIGVAVLTVLAGAMQMLGGISGYLMEPRDIRAADQALEVQGIREGYYAPPPQDTDARAYIERRTDRKADQAPDTSTMHQVVLLGTLLGLALGAAGPNALDKIPGKALIPTDVALAQPFEAIGGVLVTLLASMGFANWMSLMSSENHKLERRMTRLSEREMHDDPDARYMTPQENDAIDKPYLAKTGRLLVALIAKPFQGAIRLADALHAHDDKRVSARLPLELLGQPSLLGPEAGDAQVRALIAQPVGEVAQELVEHLASNPDEPAPGGMRRVNTLPDEDDGDGDGDDDAAPAVPAPAVLRGGPLPS